MLSPPGNTSKSRRTPQPPNRGRRSEHPRASGGGFGEKIAPFGEQLRRSRRRRCAQVRFRPTTTTSPLEEEVGTYMKARREFADVVRREPAVAFEDFEGHRPVDVENLGEVVAR